VLIKIFGDESLGFTAEKLVESEFELESECLDFVNFLEVVIV
jgi:hypothetical protein